MIIMEENVVGIEIGKGVDPQRGIEIMDMDLDDQITRIHLPAPGIINLNPKDKDRKERGKDRHPLLALLRLRLSI